MPKQKTKEKPAELSGHFTPLTVRYEHGKSLRADAPREAHASWSAAGIARDAIAMLEESNTGRMAELVPIRYGRMLSSPFAFFRGSAALMAADLSQTPNSGVFVQSCGDCHLLNFGAFATPERNLIVDISDFDETTPAPWEWDLKRLATSFVLACRSNGFKEPIARKSAEAVCRSYRTSMRLFAEMPALKVWYSKLDLDTFVAGMHDKKLREEAMAFVAKRKQRSLIDYYLPKLTEEKAGRRVFKENPPLIYHTAKQRDPAYLETIKEVFQNYRESLNEDRRILLDRYKLMDAALKIVGIGSVGTRCGVLLLMAADNDPLILQIKEARSSVLEPYTRTSTYNHHGRRVVAGQRLMQAHSDIFLGWTTGLQGYHFYLRQLTDMKMSPMPELWSTERSVEVAEAFGWVLARAHARSGDAAVLAGYMGSNDTFDKAIASFAVAYADQTETDHKALVEAVKRGRLQAYIEP